MKSPFTSLKEKALAAGVKAMINREIQDCGMVSDLVIDTVQKTICVKLDLKGEPAPLAVDVDAYKLTEKGGKVFLEVEKVSASREWIAAVLKKYAVGRPFQLPDAAKLLL